MTAALDLRATSLRRLRARIRGTLNLVAGGERIREQPGGCWRANLDQRVVYWTPLFPYPPHRLLDDSSILYLVAHEASHLKWTGRYTRALVPDELAGEFHRFVNAIEDIRVDRLSSLEFGSFERAKLHVRHEMRQAQRQLSPDGWALLDQVGINAIYSCDLDEPPFGSEEGVEQVTRLWPQLTRIANCASTQQLVGALEPIYLELRARQDELEPPEDGEDGEEAGDGAAAGGEGPATGDSPAACAPGAADPGRQDAGNGTAPDSAPDGGEPPGADEPTRRPVRSEGDAGSEPLPFGEELRGMADAAPGEEARVRLEQALVERGAAERTALAARAVQLPPPLEERLQAWLRAQQLMRGAINTLSNRLRSVLRQNAQDHWQSGTRRGRLDSGKAWRAAAGNPRIFRQRAAPGGLEYQFGLIVDVSTSMKERMPDVLNATVLVAEALERAGLGVFVVVWNDRLCAFKPTAEPLARHRGTLGGALYPHGGTYEAPALVLAADEFAAGRGRKLLMTITDGDTDHLEQSQELLAELQADGVEAVALRLGDDGIARHYREGVTVTDPRELAQLLPRLINRVVQRVAA